MGGVEQSFVNYCRLFQDLDHQTLAIVKCNAPYKESIEKLGIKAIEVENHFGYYDFFAIRKIRKLIIDFNADLVCAHVGRGIVISKKALRKIRKKTPLIAVNHSNNVKRSIGADIILSVNKEIFYKTVDLGQPSDQSFVMNNFMEVDQEKLNNFDPTKFLIEKQQIKIGTLSRLIPEKGLDHLIKAVKILKEKDCNASLKIAGDGKSKLDLENLVNSLNLKGNVDFVGWISDKSNFFNNINIFCLPSIYHETFGMVLIEAMEYNKPLIATDDVGPKSIIKNGINGILVERYPLEDLPNKIAASVIKLVENPDLVSNLVNNARNDLFKHYSNDAAKEKMREVIDIAMRYR